MRIAGIVFVLFVLAGVQGAEFSNADFETLKSRFVGPPSREGYGATSTWSFTENGQSNDATFETVAHGHAILERNSGFIAVYHPDGVHALLMTLYTRDGNQPRLRTKGFGENPNQMIFVFQDITNWKKGTEHINGLELFFKDRGHLIEKWETLKPDGTKTHFEFELTKSEPDGH
jgi:hypothetical protein